MDPIYAISFTEDYTDFDECERLVGYKKPQDYFSNHYNDEHLLVQIKPRGDLYIVVYRRTETAVATHPWTRYSWIRNNERTNRWAKMKKADWIDAVSKFMRSCGINC